MICFALSMLLLAISLPCALTAQELSRPEELAGRWEASDGQGGAVGMNILISTTVPSSSTDLGSISQRLESFQVGVYQRSGSDVQPLGFNFATTSSKGGVRWDGQHLRIDFGQRGEIPEVHVDLLWSDVGKVWSGTFERAAFTCKSITLKRPTGLRNSVFVGTWFEGTGVMNNCLHIAQAQDGTFTGWADDIRVPGRERYANGLRPLERTLENYGEIAKVNVSGPARIAVEMRANTATCCSHPFKARMSQDGSSLSGQWDAGSNQAPRPAKWVRVQANSCRITASYR